MSLLPRFIRDLARPKEKPVNERRDFAHQFKEAGKYKDEAPMIDPVLLRRGGRTSLLIDMARRPAG